MLMERLRDAYAEIGRGRGEEECGEYKDEVEECKKNSATAIANLTIQLSSRQECGVRDKI